MESPLGEVLGSPNAVSITGTENYGGPVVTAGKLDLHWSYE